MKPTRRSMGTSRQWKRARKSRRSHEVTGAVVTDGGHGGMKMSEALVDFAEPLLLGLTLPEDRRAFGGALKVAAVLWNAALDPPEGGYRRLYARLGEKVGSPPSPELEKIFDAMIVRGRAPHPGLDRMITRVEVVVESDGRCSVNVASVG
jgi:hypothetical protein